MTAFINPILHGGGGKLATKVVFTRLGKMDLNRPPTFCYFSWNLSESKFRPRWPIGSPGTLWILKGTQGGQNCPPCEISRFCLEIRCYGCWVIENNRLLQKIALAWFLGCNDAIMTSLWRHTDILMFYHRNGQHTQFSTLDPSFLMYLRRWLRFWYFRGQQRLRKHQLHYS